MDGGQVAKSKLTHRKDNKVQFYWCFDKRECRPTENFVCVIAYRYATGCGLHCDANGVDAIPTPGHSDGSTCYLVTGVDGETYLFTGDTMFPTGDGTWSTFLVPGRGGAAALRSSLELLATVRPDIVISSAFGGDTAIETLGNGRWQKCIAEALASVPS